MKESKLLLVGGYMHSGTTLMHEILSHHRNILSVIKESKILEWESAWEHGYEKETDKLSFLLNNVLKNTLKETDFTPMGKSVVEDFFNLLKYESNKLGLGYYLEGSPNSYLWLDKVPVELDYKMILVSRDPRDIIASVKKRIRSKNYGNASNFRGRITNHYSLFIYATSIKSSFKKIIHLEKESNMILIDYLDITKNYNQTINLLSEFLTIDKKYFPSENEITTRNTADINAKVPEGLYYSSNYKKVLTKREIVTIEFLFRDYFKKMSVFGVEPKRLGQFYYFLLILKAPLDLLIFGIARLIRFPSWRR